VARAQRLTGFRIATLGWIAAPIHRLDDLRAEPHQRAPGSANVSRPLATSLAASAGGKSTPSDAYENGLRSPFSSSQRAISRMTSAGGTAPQ
jgi:hypothetical protein